MTVPDITPGLWLLWRFCRPVGRFRAHLDDPMFTQLKRYDAIRRRIRPFDPANGGQAVRAGPEAHDCIASFLSELIAIRLLHGATLQPSLRRPRG